jgi:hypothetical protein
MKKISLILLGFGLVILLSGCNANGRFALHSKLTGQLATATASAQEKGNRYTIDIKVSTQGLYNFLQGKRTEHYRSTGHIRHGLYYSDLFVVERWKTKEKFHDLKEYHINHRTKKIVRKYRRWQGKKLVENTSTTLDHYGYNDYLTLLHNALKQHGTSSSKRITYTAAGSEETHGKIPIYITQNANQIKRWGGVRGGALVQMGLYKGIFKNRKGSMTVLLDRKQRPVKFYISNLETIKTLTGVPIR